MLKLKAENIEDLKILSACVQDAKFTLNEVTFLEDKKSFILMLDRYCWEKDDPASHAFFRVKSALHIECATAYDLLIDDSKDTHFVFEILSLHHKDESIFLHCVDQSVISIKADKLRVYLQDIETPIQVAQHPEHPEASA